MKTLLQILTSLRGSQGESSRLAARFVDEWRAAQPASRVITRDIGVSPVPHLTAERFAALATPPEARSVEQHSVARFSDALIGELRAADAIVLALPMYNLGVPSTLKAYFDHIARAGVTFRYTEKGPQGLITGKKAYVLAARGGLYAGTALDTQTDYVRNVLRFLGIADPTFIHAEGLATGEARKSAALAAAEAAIRSTVRSVAEAA